MHKGNLYRKFHYLLRVLCSVICMCIAFAGLASGRLFCFVSEFLILPSLIVLSYPFRCLPYFHSLPPSFLSLHYFKALSSYPFLISFVSFLPLSVLLLSLIVFPIPPLLPFLQYVEYLHKYWTNTLKNINYAII